MSVIDADGHVLEPVEMFDELPEEFHPKRPDFPHSDASAAENYVSN